MSLNMKIWIGVGLYNLVGILFWANAAYEIGKHRGKAHSGAQPSNCTEAECTAPGALCALCYFLWPIAIVCMLFEGWHSLWFNGGVNATLPPANSYPVSKKPAPEIEWKE